MAVFGKWDKAKGALTGMKLLAQVEDDLQPVYRLSQGVSQSALVKVIKTAFLKQAWISYWKKISLKS